MRHRTCEVEALLEIVFFLKPQHIYIDMAHLAKALSLNDPVCRIGIDMHTCLNLDSEICATGHNTEPFSRASDNAIQLGLTAAFGDRCLRV